jgi:hypothetical protein
MHHHYRNRFTFIILLILSVSACSKQSWYQGAQSAKEAQCLKEPVSEYEDCVKQSGQSYDEYSKTREQLLEQKQ